MSGCLIETEISIGCPADQVFDYVSQPWRWHEWHPGSQWAQQAAAPLKVGEGFKEIAALRPLPFVPLRLSSALDYVVIESDRPRVWEVRGTSPRIDLRIRYELSAGGATRFKRIFRYEVKGAAALIEPLLLRRRMRAQSVAALASLKRTLESGAARGA